MWNLRFLCWVQWRFCGMWQYVVGRQAQYQVFGAVCFPSIQGRIWEGWYHFLLKCWYMQNYTKSDPKSHLPWTYIYASSLNARCHFGDTKWESSAVLYWKFSISFPLNWPIINEEVILILVSAVVLCYFRTCSPTYSSRQKEASWRSHAFGAPVGQQGGCHVKASS